MPRRLYPPDTYERRARHLKLRDHQKVAREGLASNVGKSCAGCSFDAGWFRNSSNALRRTSCRPLGGRQKARQRDMIGADCSRISKSLLPTAFRRGSTETFKVPGCVVRMDACAQVRVACISKIRYGREHLRRGSEAPAKE